MSATETSPPSGQAPPPFESLDALREAHADLLRRSRFSDNAPAFLEEIQLFMTRGRATGAFLDDADERAAVQSVLNYWSNTLYRAGQEPPEATLADFDPTQAPSLENVPCPYVGLDEVGDLKKSFGAGWQRLVQECLDRLGKGRLLTVVGASGSGRSSLVKGGLLPALRAGKLPGSERWRYYPVLVPGAGPLEGLARLTLPAGAEEAPWVRSQAEGFRKDPGHLGRLLAEAGNEPAVLVVDQLEQVFTLCGQEEREAFLENLLGLTRDPDSRHVVILILRSDFAGHLSQLDGFYQGQVFIAFTTRELRQAIEGPARRVGLRFEQGVVERLLREIQGDPAAITLLQFTMVNLWENREGNCITQKVYERVGAGRLGLERAAEGVYQGLGPEERQTLQPVLLRLVRPGVGSDFACVRVPRESLYAGDEPRERVDRVLDRLVGARLVRLTGATPGEATVAVAHEALVARWPRLVEWLNDERDARRRRLRLTAAAEQWREKGDDPGALWRGSLLEEARQYHDLRPVEADFIRAGEAAEAREAARERRRYRFKLAALATIAGLLLLTACGAIALYRAKEEAAEARASEAEAEAEKEKAKTEAEQVLRREAERLTGTLAVDKGLRLMDTGDLSTALLWFAKSRARDEEDPGREKVYRMRLSTGLRQHPKLVQYKYDPDPITIANFTDDGGRVLWANEKGVVEISDIWKRRGAGKVTLKHRGAVNYAEFYCERRPDPRRAVRVVTASADGTARVWDAATGRPVTPPLRHDKDEEVTHAAFSPDGKYVATASRDKTARVWDANTGAERHRFRHDGSVSRVAFSPDGLLLATASEDRTAAVWSLKEPGDEQTTPKAQWRLPHDGAVTCVAFSPAQTLPPRGTATAEPTPCVVTASNDGTAVVWRLQKKGSVREITLRHSDVVVDAAFSRDGLVVVTASHDGTAMVWDRRTFNRETLKHESRVLRAAFSPDGRHVITASRDQTARVWDAETGELVAPLLHHGGSLRYASFDPSGRRAITVNWVSRFEGEEVRLGGEVRVWDLATSEPRPVLLAHQGTVHHGSMSSDGKRVVTASADGTARVWDAATGRPVTPPLRHRGPVAHATFSPDGKYVATASQDKTARLWDANTGAERHRFRHSHAVTYTAFGANGRLLVTASGLRGETGGGARVWDSQSGREVTARPFQQDGVVIYAAFSPDGHRLVTTSGRWGAKKHEQGGEARVWDVRTGKSVTRKPLRHAEAVLHAEFSPDGRLLVTTSEDDTAGVWAVETGKLTKLLRHDADVTWASFNPVGDLVVTASVDRTARVWDVTSGKPVSPPLSHKAPVTVARFSPSPAEWVLTGCLDGTAQLWDAASGTVVTPQLKHGRPVAFTTFSPDGTQVFTLSFTNVMREARASAPETFSRGRVLSRDAAQGSPSRSGRVLAARRDATGRHIEVRRWSVRPESRGLDTLRQWAHLVAARQIDDSNRLQALRFDKLAELWEGLGAQYPEHFSGDYSPDSVESWHEREAVQCEADGHWSAAVFHLQRLTDRRPSRWELRARLCQAKLLSYDLKGAEDEYRKAVDLAGPASKLLLTWLENQADVGANFRQQGATRFYLERLVKAVPDQWGPRARLARARVAAGEWKEAVNDYSGAIKLALWLGVKDKQLQQLWQGRAEAYSRLGRWEDAVRDYSEALKLRPEDWELWQGRAQAYARQDRWEDALRDYDKAIEQNRKVPQSPSLPWLRAQRAHTYAALDRWREAEGELSELLRSGFYEAWARRGLALAGLVSGHHAEYRKHCADLLGRFAQTDPPAKANSVAWTCVLGPDAVRDLDRPVQLARTAVGKSERSYAYRNTLGAALYRAGKFEEAVKELNEARKLYADEQRARGVTRVQDGKPADWFFLSMAHYKLGNKDKARECLDKGVRLMGEPGKAIPAETFRISWLPLEPRLFRREAEALLGR